jgi:predicted acyltransferase
MARSSMPPGTAAPCVEIDVLHFLYQRGFASWLAPERASLAFALAGVSLWGILLYPLYRRRIFLKV